jgi:hypothetical protein
MRLVRPVLALTIFLVGCSDEGGSDPGGDPTATGSGAAGSGDPGGVGASGAMGSGASSAGGSGVGASGGSGAAGGGPAGGIAARYPGDVGIENDPAVVFAENFEEGSVELVTARYEDAKNAAGMALVADVPAASSGTAAMQLTAGGSGAAATDLYKRFPEAYQEIYVRYYVKYAAGVDYHHTGVWFGGYNPGLDWPSPHAGEQPNGDDRFSISFEPVGGGPNPRMDFYDYWMTMHSGPNAFWGNTIIHDTSVTAPDDQWMCVEVKLRLNPDPASPAGAELSLRVDDVPVITFDDQGPVGYWLWDKFCPEGANGPECTDYPPDPGTTLVPLDQQYRNTADLGINYFWPQNYITDAPAGPVYYDDMVVATSFIGCIQ